MRLVATWVPGHVPVVCGSALLRAGAAILHQVVSGIGVFGRAIGRTRPDTASAGSLPSFEAAALPHLDAVYNLARFLCRDATTADDIVQDAYLRAFRAWAEYRGGSVRAWLFAIVRNCHLSRREQDQKDRARTSPGRSADDREVDDDPLHLVADEGDPEHALLRQDEDARVRETLAGLPDDAREILVLRDIEDCSYREIAEILGLPIGTVMSRLSRARRAFVARWDPERQEAGR